VSPDLLESLELPEPEDAIGRRTRANVSLRDVTIEELEGMLQQEDEEVLLWDDDQEDYLNFLRVGLSARHPAGLGQACELRARLCWPAPFQWPSEGLTGEFWKCMVLWTTLSRKHSQTRWAISRAWMRDSMRWPLPKCAECGCRMPWPAATIDWGNCVLRQPGGEGGDP
jgi:hypothetical protein